ncbi:MltA domain-containing protein [Falsirhodobacter sp. alg1]|uniref:murein transglycosylase A n=1 Tax=Falsirhodobacter sp. alg1 TaxID=1472418 RepID=UPI0009E98097
MEFSDIDGWAVADHAAALAVFRNSCDRIEGASWQHACAEASHAPDPRTFFETTFQPHPLPAPTLFTGYYEPELHASLNRTDRFSSPVYALPPEGAPAIPRADMPAALAGRGLEIAWLEDPAEAFFLQVQGSGRLRLPDGRSVRLGYAGKNGSEYRSIGREMVQRGIMTVEQASAPAIKDWIRAHPQDGQNLMNHNPSFVFFRVLDLPDDAGPIGTMGVPLTAMQSLAVDPRIVQLGAPVFVQAEGVDHLFVAQDTGSAIKGAGRADMFMGSGDAVGIAAGHMRARGQMFVLIPRED